MKITIGRDGEKWDANAIKFIKQITFCCPFMTNSILNGNIEPKLSLPSNSLIQKNYNPANHSYDEGYVIDYCFKCGEKVEFENAEN